MLLRDFITIACPLSQVVDEVMGTDAVAHAAAVAYGAPSAAVAVGPSRHLDAMILVGLRLSPAGVLGVLGTFDGDLQLSALTPDETHVGLVGSHEVHAFDELSRPEVQRIRTAAELHARRFLHELTTRIGGRAATRV